MILLKEQHPNVYACVPLSDGPRRYLEVYIEKENDNNDIMNSGLIFPDANLKVYPCPSLNDSAKVVNIKLSHLPLLPKKEVLEGLQRSLQVFGEIMDLGITTEPATGFFMGAGYAVLNIQQEVNVAERKLFQALSHQISWCESKEFFHATWNNMPTWCRYCHKEGHTKFECPDSKARIICYSCHQNGHRSFECPRRNMPMNTNKKRDRKSYQTKQIDSSAVTDQINELQDSDDDSNDSDYKDEALEKMSIMSDETENEVEDNVIDPEEIRQLEQDLQNPSHYLNSANNSDIFIGQSGATVPSQQPYEERETIENNMPGIEWSNESQSGRQPVSNSRAGTFGSTSKILQ
ncbi:hypothetical protein G6F37_012744 [Rhizopus arrhizus]|nr:hypothetical protein G6F38_012723 [Rhizopus arrhizus]KAG1141846.1 hypothetical protein G6F37_012744 [Rhizopus arrhizus]